MNSDEEDTDTYTIDPAAQVRDAIENAIIDLSIDLPMIGKRYGLPFIHRIDTVQWIDLHEKLNSVQTE